MGKYYQCKCCDGDGKVEEGWWAPIIVDCAVCKGKGKVDWITNITWKEIVNRNIKEKDLF